MKIYIETKSTFETFLKQKIKKNTVKCIRCRTYDFQKKCDLVT